MSRTFEDLTIQNLKSTAREDAEYQQLLTQIKEGFPANKTQLPGNIKPYFNIRDHLSEDDGLILYNERIVVPRNAKKDILQRLHRSHQGVERTKRRARQLLYWPRMNADIENLVSPCEKCCEFMDSQQKEPIFEEEPPKYAFEKVSADFFQCEGKQFLIYTDVLSGWPVVHVFDQGETTTDHLIKVVEKCFADLGVPQVFRSDNGP